MSSLDVRNAIKSFITTNLLTEKQIDLTAKFDNLSDLLSSQGVSGQMGWLGLQFIGFSEDPITVPATNETGKYRELGAIYIHIVEVARLGVDSLILNRAEAIRNAFRGQRIGSILIESVSPCNFESGATLDFEGGYTSGSVIIAYQRDIDL